MTYIKKEGVLKLLNEGHHLFALSIPNFGTTSFVRPIKTGLKDFIKYSIDGKPVHHKTYSTISDKLIFVTSKRQGLSTIKEYKLRNES